MKRISLLALSFVIFVSLVSFVGIFMFTAVADVEVSAATPPSQEAFEILQNLGVFEGIDVFDPTVPMNGRQFIQALSAATRTGQAGIFPAVLSMSRVNYAEAMRVFISVLGYQSRAAIDGGFPVGYFAVAGRLRLTANIGLEPGAPVTFLEFSQLMVNAFDVEILRPSIISGEWIHYSTAAGNTFLSAIMGFRRVHDVQITANNVTGVTLPNGAGSNRVEIGDIIYHITPEMAHVNGMIGRFVDIYYRVGNNISSPFELVYVRLSDRRYSTTIIHPSEITGFSNNVLSFRGRNDRLVTREIAPGAFVVYNGVRLLTYSAETFDFENGSVILTGTGSPYQTVIITNFVDFMVNNVIIPDRLIFSRLDARTIYFDENYLNTTYIVDMDGNRLAFEDLRYNDVLSIAAHGPFMHVIISKERIRDFTVTEITESDNGTPVMISTNGIEVEISRQFLTNPNFFGIDVGRTYTLFLNAFGQVAFMEGMASEAYSTGLMVRAAYSGGLGGNLRLKIFRTDGTMNIYNVADRLMLGQRNGEQIRLTHTQAYNALENSNHVVWYRTDDEGNIRFLNLPLEVHDPTMSDRFHVLKNPGDRAEVQSFDFRYTTRLLARPGYNSQIKFFGAGATVFFVPADVNDFDSYRVDDGSYFDTNRSITGTFYSNHPDSITANILVVRGQMPNLGPRTQAIIVTRVSTAMDRHGNITRRVVGIQNGVRVVLDAEDGAFYNAISIPLGGGAGGVMSPRFRVQPGDIIRARVCPVTQLVSNAEILWRATEVNPNYPDGQLGWLLGAFPGVNGSYRPHNMTVPPGSGERPGFGNPFGISGNPNTEMNYAVTAARSPTTGQVRIFYGWVYKRHGGLLQVTTRDMSIHSDPGELGDSNSNVVHELMNAATMGTFSVVDLGGQEITARLGSFEDILTFDNVGPMASRIITIQYWGQPTQMILINGEVSR